MHPVVAIFYVLRFTFHVSSTRRPFCWRHPSGRNSLAHPFMRRTLALAFVLSLLAQTAVFAQNKVEIAATDSPSTLLPRLTGQKVELYLKGGAKLAGKVESATPNSVHLSNLTGQEYFDAVIFTADISAVVVRVK